MNIRLKQYLSIIACTCALFSFIPQINAEPSTPPTKFIYANTLGTAGYTINQPGTYVLVEDIDFAPTSTIANAITIDNSYVTLDFNTHSIVQTNATAGVDGIEISADVHDVVVKNGTLHGFRRQTIQVNAGCFDLTFDSLNISGPDEAQCLGAMLFDGTGNPIHDVTISNCLVTEIDPTSGYVCNFVYASNVQIINCKFNHNTFTAVTTPLCALYFDFAEKSHIINCHFDDNVMDQEDVILNIILLTSSSNSAIIENCLFRYNQAANSTLLIINNYASAMTVKECSLLNNYGLRFQGISSYGQETEANAVSIESCTLANCSGTNLAYSGTIGIHIGALSSALSNEVAACRINDCHIFGGSYGTGAGIALDATSFAGNPCYVRDCRITNCSVQGVAGNTGNGIMLTEAGGPTANISGCIIENCLVEGVSGDGFVITGTDNLIKDCRAVDNTGTGFNEQGDNVWLTNLASANGPNYSVVPFGAIPHAFTRFGVDVGGGYAVFENIDIP